MGRAHRVLAVVGALIAGSVPLVALPEAVSAVGTSSITGVISDPAGPVEGATITVWPAAEAWILTTSTGPDGSYAFDMLDAGDYILRVTAVTYGPFSVGDPATGQAPFQLGDGERLSISASIYHLSVSTGRVTNLAGDPIEGVEVAVEPQDATTGDAQLTHTDADGMYRLEGIRAGSYMRQFTRAGYVSTSDVFSVDGTSDDRGDVVMWQGGMISGVVRNDQGDPVEGATVAPSVGGASATTGTDGRYELIGLIGTTIVSATAAGYTDGFVDLDADRYPDWVTITEGAVTTGQDVVLHRRGRIAGVVTGDGGPLGEVAVHATSQMTNVTTSATTDAEGRYSIEVDAGSYRVRFVPSAGGFTEESYVDDHSGNYTAVEVTADVTTTGIDADLEKPGTVSGYIRDQLGDPVAGAYASVWSGLGPRSSQTGVDGRYELADLPPGRMVISFSHPGVAGVDIAVVVPSAGVVTLDAVLRFEYGTLSGFVASISGRPLAGVRIEASGNGGTFTATTGINGRYSIDRVLAGSYTVRASDVGARGETGYAFVDAAGGTADFTLLYVARIEGTVTVPPGFVDFPNIRVEASSVAPYGGWGSAFVQPDGTYSVDNLNPGTYAVRFVPYPEHLFAEYYDDALTPELATTVTVDEGDVVGGIDALIEAGGTVDGTITDQDGNPLSNVSVSVRAGFVARDVFTREDGTFTFVGLAPGEYSLAAARHGLATVTRTITTTVGSAQTVDLVMPIELGSLSGCIVDSEGAPVLGGWLSLSGPTSEFANTGDGGCYEFSNLFVGDYEIVVTSPPWYLSERADVTVVVGANTRDVVVTVPGVVSGRVTAGGAGLAASPVYVWQFDSADYIPMTTYTDDGGYYRFEGRPGDYRVLFPGASAYATEYYNNAYERADAIPVTIRPQRTTINIDADLEAYGQITGMIHDLAGNPLAHVVVSIVGADGVATAVATTGLDGTYNVGRLVAGRYVLAFERPGTPRVVLGESGAPSVVELAAGGTAVRDVVLSVHPGRIEGRVLDAAGQPISGATLSIAGFDGQATAVTGADGTYQFENLTGWTELTVKAAGFLDSTTYPVAVGGITTVHDVTMARAATLRGAVRNDAGEPVAGATVTLSLYWWWHQGVVTGDDGSYEITDLRPGTYRLDVGAPGYAPYTSFSQVVVESTVSVTNVTLSRYATVSGRVLDTQGNPVVSAQVQTANETVWTDSQGAYALTHVTGGFAMVTVVATDFVTTRVSVPAAAGEAVVGFDITLVRLGSLTGRIVTSRGQGLYLIRVEWVPTGGPIGWPITTYSDADGRFTLAGISGVGKVKVTAGGHPAQFFDGDGTFGADTVTVVEGVITDIGDHTLSSPGSIAGSVTTIDGPVVGANVSAYSLQGLGTFTTTTNGEGSYLIAELPQGTYQVKFVAADPALTPEFWPDNPIEQPVTSVTVVGGRATTAIDAHLEPGGQLTGVATGPDGRPLVGARVSAYQYTSYAHAMTDALGRYRLAVGWGEWVVNVHPADPSLLQSYSSSAIPVASGATVTSDAQLVAGGQLTIHAQGTDGFSVMSVCVDPAAPTTGGSLGIQCAGQTSTARFRYGGEQNSTLVHHAFGLAPGRYRVAALGADGSAMTTIAEFVVSAGQVVDCTLRFGSSSTCGGGPVDDTPPIVTCADQATFVLNQPSSSVRATATDGAATWEVSAGADTTRIGAQQVVVSAMDPDGNKGDATCTFQVVYKFSGFSSPVSERRINVVRYRDYIRLEWRLTDYQGHRVGGATSFVSFQTKVHNCRSQAKLKTIRSGRAPEGFAVRSTGKFRYVWEPGQALRGKCVTATVTLADGTSHSAEFKVR